MNSPIVSFQLESEAANDRLLELVQEILQSTNTKPVEDTNKSSKHLCGDDTRNEQQFQVSASYITYCINRCEQSLKIFFHMFCILQLNEIIFL